MKKWIACLFMAQSAFGLTYFVNPSTGNDANSGLSPSLAWKTPGQINGFSFASGDILVIDTSSAMLDISATNLTINTPGLTVKATNSTYWTCQLWVTLTNSTFSAQGIPNIYQATTVNPTTFGQSNIVVWEDDKWMNHPLGGTFASVSNNLATNTGSFWTDGTTIYVHPFGNTSPLTDGKVYTRSVARDPSGFANAINLNSS